MHNSPQDNPPQCILSGQSMKQWLFIPCDWRRPTVNQNFQLYWCDTSQFGFIYPLPKAHEIPKFYDVNYYTHQSQSEKKSTVIKNFKNFLDRIKIHIAWRFDHGVELTISDWQELAGKKNANICEIGCGNGERLEGLKSLGNNVIGLEPDNKAINQVLAKGIKVLAGTAEFLPDEIFDQGKFDLVIMNHVLEHTLDPLLAINNAKKLLTNDGKLVIETPNNLATGLKESGITWFNLDVPRHLYFFTPQSLCKIAEKVGLKVVRQDFSGYCRQFHSDWIGTEKQIWQSFQDYRSSNPSGDQSEDSQILLPKPNSLKRSWVLLCKTLFAKPEFKYDSVRIITTKA